MLTIKNKTNSDGTISFNADEGSSLKMKIDGSTANVVGLNAPDEDVYDGLVKTAYAYAQRRGFYFNKEGITWKPRNCQQLL
jgi:hypothetical protein